MSSKVSKKYGLEGQRWKTSVSNSRNWRSSGFGETKVKDLHHLADMQTLKNLDVTKLKPKSWDFISTLTGLEILDLCKTSFSDPSLLLNLPNLKKVRLSGSEVDPQSSSFKALEKVMLQRVGNLIMK